MNVLTPQTVVALVVVGSLSAIIGYLVARVRGALDIRRARKDALSKGRATIRGQVAEQLAPLADGFPFAPGDARFLGAPIDYVVFDRLGEEGAPIDVVLVEVKTGRAKLSTNEKRVRDAIEAGRVRFEIVRL